MEWNTIRSLGVYNTSMGVGAGSKTFEGGSIVGILRAQNWGRGRLAGSSEQRVAVEYDIANTTHYSFTSVGHFISI